MTRGRVTSDPQDLEAPECRECREPIYDSRPPAFCPHCSAYDPLASLAVRPEVQAAIDQARQEHREALDSLAE